MEAGKEGVLSGSLAEDILGDEATSDEGCGRGAWELCDGDGLLGPPRKRALMPEKRLDIAKRRGENGGCSKQWSEWLQPCHGILCREKNRGAG